MKTPVYTLIAALTIGSQNGAVAQDELPLNPSDTQLASQLTDCFNGLTAIDGLTAVAEVKVDRERLLKSKKTVKLGAFALVGDAKANELYKASKVKVQDELTSAIQDGSKGIANFVQRYIDLCANTTELHGSYIGGRIAADKRLSSEVVK